MWTCMRRKDTGKYGQNTGKRTAQKRCIWWTKGYGLIPHVGWSLEGCGHVCDGRIQANTGRIPAKDPVIDLKDCCGTQADGYVVTDLKDCCETQADGYVN